MDMLWNCYVIKAIGLYKLCFKFEVDITKIATSDTHTLLKWFGCIPLWQIHFCPSITSITKQWPNMQQFCQD